MNPEEWLIMKRIFDHGHLFAHEVQQYGIQVGYLQNLIQRGLVTKDGDVFTLSAAGRNALSE